MNTPVEVKKAAFQGPHWKQIREIRDVVFIEEQAVDPEEEFDDFEASSRHFCGFFLEKPAGTARWRRTEKGIKLERFAVLKNYRNKGLGRALVAAVLKDVFEDNFQAEEIYLHAQVHAIPFYESCGFEARGETFSEAGILHRIMFYTGNQPAT